MVAAQGEEVIAEVTTSVQVIKRSQRRIVFMSFTIMSSELLRKANDKPFGMLCDEIYPVVSVSPVQRDMLSLFSKGSKIITFHKLPL